VSLNAHSGRVLVTLDLQSVATVQNRDGGPSATETPVTDGPLIARQPVGVPASSGAGISPTWVRKSAMFQ
jgi:hypothetical protein